MTAEGTYQDTMGRTHATKTCEFCGREFKNAFGLKGHMAIHNAPPDPKREGDALKAKGVEPGSIVGTGLRAVKVPYSMKDLEAKYPKVTIIPNKTVAVLFNGVSVQFVARRAITVPSIFADLYANSENEDTNQQVARQPGDVGGVHVLPGAGPINAEGAAS